MLAALEALLRLRQACCHPALLPGAAAETLRRSSSRSSSALEDAVAEGHKALVFSQWTSLLDLVEPQLGARGPRPSRASTARTRDRGGRRRAFQRRTARPCC